MPKSKQRQLPHKTKTCPHVGSTITYVVHLGKGGRHYIVVQKKRVYLS